MRKILLCLGIAAIGLLGAPYVEACTNFLIAKRASADGSVMISYAADSHVLYGELYYRPAATHPEGAWHEVYDWDTGQHMGKIPQVRQTYSVIGNMNEFQVAIGETTYGGRPELESQEGAIMDYGSLIYVALQRSKSAREAIRCIAELMAEYGYASSGESFSVADKDEVWIMELIGKGNGHKGAVWVARRVPDDCVCAHANHPRITTFPWENGLNSISSKNLDRILEPQIDCVYAEDVCSFARSKGWYEGEDKDFSFADAYAPLDFEGARFCEIRVWAMFRQVKDGMDQYADYAMGHNLKNRMPLWIRPDRLVSVSDMMRFMRDHLEGTELDMTKDVGAGPFGCPYRWRPLTWEVDGVTYCNERATSTQQTGFSFVTQSRSWLPDPIGGIFWFGVDDAASTVYMPFYCSVNRVPEAFRVGNGNMTKFSDTSAFWTFNQVSNFAYTRYNVIHPEIAKVQKAYEDKFIAYTPAVDAAARALLDGPCPRLATEFLTDYSVNTASSVAAEWREFYRYLFIKFSDGNIKTPNPPHMNPNVRQPGYGEAWYRRIVEETGDRFRVIGEGH